MSKPITKNTLFYGDNLPILREYIPDESVDLIYLDPPFNSNRSYNVLFKDESGKEADAQITAFEDTWHWGEDAERTYHDIIQNASLNIAKMVSALREFIGANQVMAYLTMMTARLIELHRVLKSTGSLYLHCDPTASHYLKIVLDTIFGVENYRNEIIWQRTLAKAHTSRQLPNNHDVIFCYQKSVDALYNVDAMFMPYDSANLDEKTKSKYHYHDPDGRVYRLDNLINPNPDRPNLTYEFLGILRVWRWTKSRMEEAHKSGLVVQTKPGAVPQLKRYLDEQRGRPFGDIWSDISPINSQALERLGYPTQKPITLLERIIKASTKDRDIILDPFCGCGTAIIAAEKLNRRWIGIDITYLSISLMKYRLKDSFGLIEKKDYHVVGEPESIEDARHLARDNRYQFQWWALSLVQAKPLGGEIGTREGKKGADKGMDGIINFLDEKDKTQRILIQVKSGHVKSADIRDLRGVLERENAAIGVFITLEEPSKEMITEALSSGYYHSQLWQKDYPRIQIVTVEKLLNGKEIEMPPGTSRQTFIQAPKVTKKDTKQEKLF